MVSNIISSETESEKKEYEYVCNVSEKSLSEMFYILQ
jgi:hypothetical protein